VSAFDSLRHEDRPTQPDRRFAAHLRTRLTDALVATVELPERNRHMTDSVVTTGALHPYITVGDAAAAIDWYTEVFDAHETVRYVGDDGRIGHGEIEIGGAKLMLSDEYPDFGAVSPGTVGGTPVKLYVEVPDVDAVWELALTNGADGQRPPADQAYGRRACAFADPFGHRWMVQTVTADPSTAEIEDGLGGDFTVVTADPTASEASGPTGGPVEVGYLTMPFDDTAAARRFYGALFGWQAEDGSLGGEYAHVGNTRLPIGMKPGGVGAPTLYFRIDDADRYAEQVAELGGSVLSRASHASGETIECVDDQGSAFTLWRPAEGY